MDADDRAADILPFYYFCVVFSVAHLIVSATLFVRQRAKFPISGHNIALTTFIGTALTAVTVADATGAIAGADTCSVATAVVCLVCVVLVNFLTTQGLRLWFEYNYAEERARTLQASRSGQSPPGWYASKRKYFESTRLVATAVVLSVIEGAVCIGLILSLEETGYGVELQCTELISILSVTAVYNGMTMTFFLFIFWKFRNKRDGFGLKDTFKWWGVIWFTFSPAILLILAWEAVTDLAYYVDAIRVLFIFLAVEGIMVFTLDVPLYLSFFESAQRGLSSISRADDSLVEDEEQVAAVLTLARGEDSVADADVIELHGSSHVASHSQADMPSSEATEHAPEVFSSKTLTLALADILLNPAYSAQMTSFTRHLVGEFNVEGLLFFLRVLNFQNFARSHKALSKSAPELEASVVSAEQSDTRSSSDDDVVLSEELAAGESFSDLESEVAWKAMQVYFEFLGNGAPAQINVGHRIADPIAKEFEEAVVDFRQLPANVSPDDFRLKRPIDPKVFDNAQNNVFKMIERDPFVRWRKAIRERVDKLGEKSQNIRDSSEHTV